jgi:hypothetical protein
LEVVNVRGDAVDVLLAERSEHGHRARANQDRFTDLPRRRLHQIGRLEPAADRCARTGRDVAGGAVQAVEHAAFGEIPAGGIDDRDAGPVAERTCVVDEGDDLLLGVADGTSARLDVRHGQRHPPGTQHKVDSGTALGP